MKFEHMTHTCLDAANGRAIKEVTEFDIEYNRECDVCGERLAPTREVLAYIYSYLLEKNDD